MTLLKHEYTQDPMRDVTQNSATDTRIALFSQEIQELLSLLFLKA